MTTNIYTADIITADSTINDIPKELSNERNKREFVFGKLYQGRSRIVKNTVEYKSARNCSNRSGGMILSLMVAILALAFLTGYLLNMGAESCERQRMQHAADAVAYSSAVWLARGMNATASMNHAMGENTAFCAILESLAGPEYPDFEPCLEEMEMNSLIGSLSSSACNPLDERDPKRVSDLVVLCINDHTRHTAAGACYDSELLLKYYIAAYLTKKAIATLFIEGANSYSELLLLLPLGLEIHRESNERLDKIKTELEKIYELEKQLGNNYKVNESGESRDFAIPVGSYNVRNELRANINKINARFPNVTGSDKQKPKERQLYQQIYATAEEIKKVCDFDTATVAPLDTLVYSSKKNSKSSYPLLPVLAEEESQVKSNSIITTREKEWKNKTWTKQYGSEDRYNKMPAIPWEGNYNCDTDPKKLEWLDNEKIDIGKEIIQFFIWMYEKSIYQSFKAEYGEWLKERIENCEKALNTDKWQPEKYGHYNNPSVWSYPADCFDYEKEKTSQWVRATYPAVDDLRGRLVAKYKDELPISNIAPHLSAWSWRYVLSESYYNRTGKQRPYGVYTVSQPCHMYVIAGTEAKNKGNETFWTNEKKGAPIIDQMFCIAAAVEAKKHEAVVAPFYFKRHGQFKKNTTVAQAMFYSATGRNSKSTGILEKNKNRDCQPCTGWDTLQWKNFNEGDLPEIRAKEWWNALMSEGPEMDYKDLLVSKPIPRSENIQLQFNWQAMLCPITKSRIQKLKEDSSADDDLKKAAQSAANHSGLFTH